MAEMDEQSLPEPPEKLDPVAVAYAWVEHVAEVAAQALAHLALLVPEDADAERAKGHVTSRAGAFIHGHTNDAPPQVSGHPDGYDPERD